jgi:hypothetical protein
METGVSYNKKKLHQAGDFTEFLATNEEISESLRPLLRLNRGMLVGLEKIEHGLLRSLESDPQVVDRVSRLLTIPGIGPVTALSWVLEVGEVKRARRSKWEHRRRRYDTTSEVLDPRSLYQQGSIHAWRLGKRARASNPPDA